MTSVVDEAIRTIRVSVVVTDKNTKMSQIFDQTVKEALLTRIESMGESEIDTIMSLIPEAQFERLAVGTPLLEKDGKRFTVLGSVQDYHVINNEHSQQLFHNINFEESRV